MSTTTTLYFAYGSNLCTRSMARRCPDSIAVGPATLPGWRLTFRGVADVERSSDHEVTGALWLCPPEDVAALDRYEGVAGGFYSKEALTVVNEDGEERTALVYVMVATYLDNCSLPSRGYLDTIVRGYHDFGLPIAPLEEALAHTYDRVVRVKGVTEFVPHGPKRMGPAGTTRGDRTVRTALPKKERKRRRRRAEGKGNDAPGAKSPATLAEEALERRDEARRVKARALGRSRNDAALAVLQGDRPPAAVTTRSGRPLSLPGERVA